MMKHTYILVQKPMLSSTPHLDASKNPLIDTCIQEESCQDNLSPIHALLVTLMIILATNSTARSTCARLLSFSTDILPSGTKSAARAC